MLVGKYRTQEHYLWFVSFSKDLLLFPLQEQSVLLLS